MIEIRTFLCALTLGASTHAHAEDAQLSDYQAARLACFEQDGRGNRLDEGYLVVFDQIDVVSNKEVIDGTKLTSLNYWAPPLPFKINIFRYPKGTPYLKDGAERVIATGQTVAVPYLQIEGDGLFVYGEKMKNRFWIRFDLSAESDISFDLLSSGRNLNYLVGELENTLVDDAIYLICLPVYTVSFEETHRLAPKAVKEHRRIKGTR